MLEARPCSEPLRIACVGDSLTRGDALHELPQRHRVPASRLTKRFHIELRQRGNYPSLLQRLLPGARVRNFGHGGATACNASELPYAETREFRRARKFAADVVVVMLGTNDAKGRFWRPGARCGPGGAGFESGLEQIIAALRAASTPPPMLFLVPPPPILRDKFDIRRELLPPIRARLAALARRLRPQTAARSCGAGGVELARGAPIAAVRSAFTSDGIHLTANSSALVACAVHEALRGCLDERCGPRTAHGALRAPRAVFVDADATEPCGRTVGSGVDAPVLFTGMPCVEQAGAVETHAGPSAPAPAEVCAALLRRARSAPIEHELRR